MSNMQGFDAVNGRMGRAFAKVNGNNEEMFYLKRLEAKAEKIKTQVKPLGTVAVAHKTAGYEITGSATMYYMTSMFRKLLAEYKATGVDLFFDVLVENEDPASRAGKQTVLLKGVNLDSVVLAKLDGEGDDPLDEEIAFTAEDFEILQAFKTF